MFSIIIITSLLSLDQFSKFSLGDECTSISHLLHKYPQLAKAVLPFGSEQGCLGIVPSLEPGYFVFATASLTCVILCAFVAHAANVSLEQQAKLATKPISAMRCSQNGHVNFAMASHEQASSFTMAAARSSHSCSSPLLAE